ncbi:MAG: ABC transporter permease subunit [Propionibacteriales bacterium]|nr:ABC transporter permease subunit [Propionibacteriales bacterium]
MARVDIQADPTNLAGGMPLPDSPTVAVATGRQRLVAGLRSLGVLPTIGLVVVLLLVVVAVFAPLIAPFDATAPASIDTLAGPSGAHWFGTDMYGRDVLSRVIVGAQVSMVVGFAVTIGSLVIGGLLGLVAGFVGGLVDRILGQLTDVLLAVPGILLAIAIVAMLGSGIRNVCIALTIGQIPLMLRVVRSATLSISQRPMVRAARAIGARPSRVLLRHIAPYVWGTAVVQCTFTFAHAILYEAGLSFLGIGVQPPEPTWGNMVSEARAFIGSQPWNAIFPGLAIVVVVLAINLVGDGLRDLADPESRGRGR